MAIDLSKPIDAFFAGWVAGICFLGLIQLVLFPTIGIPGRSSKPKR